MNGRFYRLGHGRGAKLLAVFLVAGFCAGPLAFGGGEAWARDRRDNSRYGGGRYIERLPRGHSQYNYRGRSYYYHGGQYFRHSDRGYAIVRPPRGFHIRALPLGYTALVLAGITYFTYLGVYYQPAPGGYVVVAPPVGAPQAPAPSMAYASVSVIVPDLNLRQGPGLNHAIVGLVSQGDVLTVYSSVNGWLYVQAPNGQAGWVDHRYTAPMRSGAAG